MSVPGLDIGVNYKFVTITPIGIVSLLKDKEDCNNVSVDESQQIEFLLNNLLRSYLKATVFFYQLGQYQTVWLRVLCEQSKGRIEPVLIKVGLKEIIRVEEQRYLRYVKDILITHATFQRSVCYTDLYGGITYSIDNGNFDQVTRFSSFYQHAPVERIQVALRNLFVNTCGGWRNTSVAPQPGRIDHAYLRLVGLEASDAQRQMEEAIKDLSEGREDIKRDDDKLLFWLGGSKWVSYRNPWNFITSSSFNLPDKFPCARGHGHLAGHKFLVERLSLVGWLIGFAQCGDGPALRDYVRLEAQVRWEWVSDMTLAVLHSFENVLCKPDNLLTPLDVYGMPEKLIKPLRTIEAIRQHAGEVDVADWRDYQVGLLVHALGIVASGGSTDPYYVRLSRRRREHALMAAAMIADQLAGTIFSGVTADWIFRRDGNLYFVNAVSGETELDLNGLQRDMFELLFQKQGQVCYFDELKGVLGPIDIHGLKSDLAKRLNAIEGGLGKCIHNRFGSGYRLVMSRSELSRLS